VRAGPTISNSREKSNPTVSVSEEATVKDGLVDAILEIGRECQRIMEGVKAALLRGDNVAALEHARELTGLSSKQKTASSIAS
jgi:hypothetical protein